MPPKPKFTKDEIIAAALRLTRTQGVEAVTAREVGKSLGVTATPIFTYFSGMDELLQCVVQEARRLFQEYLMAADAYQPAFKMRGMQMIRFAQEEPKLFQLLFISEHETVEFSELMQQHIVGFTADLEDIQRHYQLTQEQAFLLFRHLWMQAYGICVLCCSNICRFSQQEIAAMLGETFAGTILLFRHGGSEYTKLIPLNKDITPPLPLCDELRS